ncbi:hypothetical protein P775_28495 [Puniceibacterium antarcticum]|uniref:Uncharacterized protein n=1 Tax=Puniceibacterium antarcticum TaxID=1206336 RepID=A0A2G8QT21_9RHOB|nr:hypothetical protein P775_28495 [Puniceibacterium antarcticum]
MLTFAINRGVGAFQAATGIRIEEKHAAALHSAMLSGAKAALRHGLEVGLGVLKDLALAHVQRSVPDAICALVPGDGVLDNLAERYVREALETYLPQEKRRAPMSAMAAKD